MTTKRRSREAWVLRRRWFDEAERRERVETLGRYDAEVLAEAARAEYVERAGAGYTLHGRLEVARLVAAREEVDHAAGS